MSDGTSHVSFRKIKQVIFEVKAASGTQPDIEGLENKLKWAQEKDWWCHKGESQS